MNNQIRLSQEEIESIKAAFKKNFNADDHLWIFGSRVYPDKRGGDIDLYIEIAKECKESVLQKELRFLTDLDLTIGEQKIDVVINKQTDFWLPIYDVAKKEGILLV